MADETINIQIVDNVPTTIATKLSAIADAANSGQAAIDALKAALSGIQSPELATLKSQADTLTQSIKNDLAATNDLQKAQQSEQAQVVSLANAFKTLQSNADSATASINKAASAAKGVSVGSNLFTAYDAQQGVNNLSAAGQARVAQPDQDAVTAAARETAANGAADMAALSAAAASAGKNVDAVEDVIEDVGTKGTSWFSKLTASASGFFGLFTGNGASGVKTLATDAEAAAPKLEDLATHSINASTAIRELLTLAREGSTGNFTRMAGSASILATALGVLTPALIAAAAGFAGLYAARNSFNTNSEDTTLKNYAESLGLTSEEMKKLDDTTLDASGDLKTHNDLVVTYGDTLNGLWTTIKQGVSAYGGLSSAWTDTVSAFKTGMEAMLDLVLVFIGEVEAAEEPIIDLGMSAYDALTGNMQKAHKDIADMASDIENFFTNANKNALNAKAGLDAFMKAFQQNTDAAAKQRVGAEAGAIISNRTPKAPSTKKTQDDYLNDENQKLNDQIALFGKVGEAREVQQQLNSVEEAFLKRRMPLDQAQIDALTQKITLGVHLNAVQSQMNSIYSQTQGVTDTYNDAMEALNKLFDDGTISQEQYTTQFNKLVNAYRSAEDPLDSLKQQYIDGQKTIDAYGDSLDHANNALKVFQAQHAAGKVNGNGVYASDADKQSATDTTALLDQQTQQQYIKTNVSSAVDPILQNQKYLDNYKSFIDQINELEQKGVLNHDQAAQAKAAIDAKYDDIRLQGAETVFSSLAELSQSKNKELAAIGKAAAMIDATIKGYQAIQNAYAEVPYPFNIAAAAAMAVATGVQVANIASASTNVGSYWDGGSFVVRGKTGVDSNRISMNVSDGEKITVQTQAQQQTEAQNNKQTGGGTGDTHVNNYFDEASFVAAMDSQDGDRVIMNHITRNKKTYQSLLGVNR